jgi:hypothetical protein
MVRPTLARDFRGKPRKDPDSQRRRRGPRARFLLGEEEAQRIVNDMKVQVEATWYETLRASGVSENDAEAIRGAFVYPGFSL